MKICKYCGRENESDAEYCAECGTDEFRAPVPPKYPAVPGAPESDSARLHRVYFRRTFLGFGIIALLVCSLGVYCARDAAFDGIPGHQRPFLKAFLVIFWVVAFPALTVFGTLMITYVPMFLGIGQYSSKKRDDAS
jgi:hypothetical protein